MWVWEQLKLSSYCQLLLRVAVAPGAAITTVLLVPFATGALAVPMLELLDEEFAFAV